QPTTFTPPRIASTRCDFQILNLVEPQEQAADEFRYVMWGTLDEPETFPPKGEFFCENRAGWMPEIPGLCPLKSSYGTRAYEVANERPEVFHKDKIEE